MEDIHQSTKKGKSFTTSQDVAIYNAWLSVPQDSVIGSSQTQVNFWNRTIQNYIDNNVDDVRAKS